MNDKHDNNDITKIDSTNNNHNRNGNRNRNNNNHEKEGRKQKQITSNPEQTTHDKQQTTPD